MLDLIRDVANFQPVLYLSGLCFAAAIFPPEYEHEERFPKTERYSPRLGAASMDFQAMRLCLR